VTIEAICIVGVFGFFSKGMFRRGEVIVELRAGAKGPFLPSKCVDVLADDAERNLQDD
jgi:hypothetical protein